ncbi:MAG: GTPase ObgE [Bacilli bacterium]|nr:GTPase ObgE [Bacilli bacterium]
MFVDEVNLKLIAGKGGDGCTSFRREKYVPMGGPDGGNGGKGADIIFKVDKGLKTLVDLKFKKIIKADKGTNGKGSNRFGSNADNLIIKVPEGTTVYDKNTNLIICDLVNDGQEFIIAHGGRGGRGNKAFVTDSEPAPKFSEYGEPGEELEIHCELKVMADVGLVGMPSVGKSTFLKLVSNANPKIADYHFTTLSPNLGVVKVGSDAFTIADLPGLIEGASTGLGLGIKFLKHAMRTKVIAHVIDMGAFEGRNPIEDYEIIKNEMDQYSNKFKDKKAIVIATKMDLENAEANLEAFKKAYPDLKVYPISALDESGVKEVVNDLNELVKSVNETKIYDENEFIDHVTYEYQKEVPFKIEKDPEGVYIVSGKEVEKLFLMTKFTEEEGVLRFGRRLKGMGVDDCLRSMGAKAGDTIQIMDYVFEFNDEEDKSDYEGEV